MIRANKNFLFQKLFHFYNTHWLLKRSFFSVRLKGHFPNNQSPFLVLVNHSSWWDGLVSFYLSQTVCHKDSYAMMSEEGLKQFPFFGKLGAFSVSKDRTSIIRSLRYAITLLEQQKAIWIFPQGMERHLESRPLAIQPGASFLIEKVPTSMMIPITYYYTFLHEQKPELFIQIGDAFHLTGMNRKDRTIQIENLMTIQLDQQRENIINEQMDDYRVLFKGKQSISNKFRFTKN